MNATGTHGSAMTRNSATDFELESPALRLPAHPVAGLAGASFKPEHLPSILADRERHFFAVHAENYMDAGGPPHRSLEIIHSEYPESLHGVCMSIDGPDALDNIQRCRHERNRFGIAGRRQLARGVYTATVPGGADNRCRAACGAAKGRSP